MPRVSEGFLSSTQSIVEYVKQTVPRCLSVDLARWFKSFRLRDWIASFRAKKSGR
jgi:hypothetical protein